jgi:hypothetical protein
MYAYGGNCSLMASSPHLKYGWPVAGSISMLHSFTVAPMLRASSSRLWYTAYVHVYTAQQMHTAAVHVEHLLFKQRLGRSR